MIKRMAVKEEKGGQMNPKTSAAVVYIPFLGWMPAAAFLILEKDRDVRWHAVQSLLMHGVVFGVYWVVVPVLKATIVLAPVAWLVSGAGGVAFLIASLYMVTKVAEGKRVRIPVVTELVDKIAK